MREGKRRGEGSDMAYDTAQRGSRIGQRMVSGYAIEEKKMAQKHRKRKFE